MHLITVLLFKWKLKATQAISSMQFSDHVNMTFFSSVCMIICTILTLCDGAGVVMT